MPKGAGKMRVTEKMHRLILYSGLVVFLALQILDRYVVAFPRWLEIASAVLALIFLVGCIAVEIALHRQKVKKRT